MYLLQRAGEIVREDGLSSLVLKTADFLRSMSQAYQLYYRMLKNRRRYDAVADPTKIVWVPAADIQEKISLSSRWKLAGSIEGGDWDRNTTSLNEHYKFEAVKERFSENKSWEETGIIDKITEMAERRDGFDDCNDRVDVVQRYETMDEMYESLKENGYDMSKHISNPKWYNPITIQAIDHPMVCIGRNGDLLLTPGGFHRVSMAHLLEIEIPVWVVKRHREWQLLREEIYQADSREDLSSEAKAQLDHPDMQDVVSPEIKR